MRKKLPLKDGWHFTGPDGIRLPIALPHTWNNLDGQDGGDDYHRGSCSYHLDFPRPDFDPNTQDVYLEFEGVNASALVSLNGKEAGQHHGGYSTFRMDITPLLQDQNKLQVDVDNSVNDRVYPQKADFTFYGGIYRDVQVLIISKKRFDLDYFGSPGVKISPQVLGRDATITVESWTTAPEAQVSIDILDHQGQIVTSAEGQKADIHLAHPRLWRGLKDPYLYCARLQLKDQGQVVDQVSLRFGVRSFHIDKHKGFFLNGSPYPLKGVSRHQDFKGLGNAISKEQQEADLAIIREVGANSIRLAHYQHDQYVYDRCDELGFVVWAEIPYISEHLPGGRENTISQMKELIAQNHHHPCIVTWGVSNEITISTKDKKDMLDNHRVLNQLCKDMDSSRPTTLACYAVCSPFNRVAHITDLVGWNLYLGWYVPGLFLNDLWISFFHWVYPNRPLSYSEYGCEGMPNLHAKRPRRNDHSEEYQSKYHEFMLRCFKRHPYLWSVYVWNMFDFAADTRDQGGEAGMNHKGLVTFDRSIKKDSFYLYKAFWSEEPFVHIAGKRKAQRSGRTTKVQVFTNQKELSLYNNGQLVGNVQADKTATFTLKLSPENHLEAVAGQHRDQAILVQVDKANPDYRLKKKKKTQKSNWV